MRIGAPHGRRTRPASTDAPSPRVLRLAAVSARGVEKIGRSNGAPVGYVLDRGAERLKPVLDDILAIERFGLDVHVFFVDRLVPGHARWIAREVTERGIRHLHAHLATVDVARHVKRLTHVGYSFTFSGNAPFDATRDVSTLRDFVHEADFVVAPSEVSRDRLLAATGHAAAASVFRIYRGVDIDRFVFTPDAAREADAILAVGPVVHASGFEDLIDAVTILRDRRTSRVRLTIAGAGASVQKLRTRIAARHLQDRVTLIAADDEAPAQRTVSDLMRVHTLMALPYRRLPSACGGVPSVLLEAMATGLPVVSTAVDGISEVIDDGWTGRLIAPREPHWLAGAIETMLDNVRLRARMAANAREEIERSFNQASNTSELARLLSMAAVDGTGCATEAQ
jgi:glycosyltransferase involved in cell wall biosynthesis